MQPKYTPQQLERFWEKVDKDSSSVFYNGARCWEWTASRFHTGYGSIRIAGKLRYAHRVAYEISFGNTQSRLDVLHKCDNPPCVNPEHLFAGTHKENMDDMVRKGRQRKPGPNTPARGEASGKCKLTDQQVDEIRRRYRRLGIGGETSTTLANEYGVSPRYILDIVNRVCRSY